MGLATLFLEGAGDGALMLDEDDSLPVPARWRSWAGTLPPLAAEVVFGSDLAQPHVYLQAEALAAQVRVMRSAVAHWARQVGFESALEQDVVLAADEAVSNAVEHAYPDAPGTVTLVAACSESVDAARIIVSDQGLWRPPAADPGCRGRGLAMMERLAHVFRLAHTPHGTTVVLGWVLG